MYTFVALINRGVPTIVGEIWRCRNDGCYYYSMKFLQVDNTVVGLWYCMAFPRRVLETGFMFLLGVYQP